MTSAAEKVRIPWGPQRRLRDRQRRLQEALAALRFEEAEVEA